MTPSADTPTPLLFPGRIQFRRKDERRDRERDFRDFIDQMEEWIDKGGDDRDEAENG